MSRIAKTPIIIPPNIDITVDIQTIIVKGDKGKLTRTFNKAVKIVHIDNIITLHPRDNYKDGWAQAGTARSLLNSMIIGVNNGFIKKLQLIGVGYRAVIEENIITMYLGFTHPVYYKLPVGVIAECPTQNEILISGADKQLIGQVAADIRSYRRPEPYKGKGIKYEYEVIRSKEAKKK